MRLFVVGKGNGYGCGGYWGVERLGWRYEGKVGILWWVLGFPVMGPASEWRG